MRLAEHLLACLLSAALTAAFGCAGTTGGPSPDDSGCDTDGVRLNIFGKAARELFVGDTADLSVVLTRPGKGEKIGEYVAGREVKFRLAAGAPADVRLTAETAESDPEGIAAAVVQTGTTPAPNVQVTASAGTCNVTFSLAVRRPVRRVTIIGPSPRDAFTSTRVMITAAATTDDGAALGGQAVTFSLGTGATASMKLLSMDAVREGNAMDATTAGNGWASVLLETGTEPATVTIRAEMAETAPASADVRVNHRSGTGGCNGDFDCPVGLICSGGECVNPAGGACQSDAQCTAPDRCIAGKCVKPDVNGTPCSCSPASGLCTGCSGSEVCIAGFCTAPPSACTSNEQCPIGWQCLSGVCHPSVNPCGDGNPCTGGLVCQAGQCQPPSNTECSIPNRPTNRLQGNWRFLSVLHLEQAAGGIFGAFLDAASMLQDIITGGFSIGGIPSWITKAIDGFIKKLLKKYVPPWGFQMVSALSDIHDILTDMRVWSTVQITSSQPDLYRASERWDQVGFVFRGQDIITAPENVPEIGEISIDDYTVREICGTFYADNHTVSNAVGGLIKWAVEVAVTAASCVAGTCYYTITEALQDIIDCYDIGTLVDDMIHGLFESAPDVSGAVANGCTGLKQTLINLINRTLQDLDVQLSLMSIRGQGEISTASIPNPPAIQNGIWSGSLGLGDFSGTFQAVRQ